MQPSDLEKIPLQVEKLFLEMQGRVMKDIVRRIKKTGGITSTADYQAQKLIIFGNSTEFIESETKRLLDATDPEIWEIYDTVIDQDYTRDKNIYEQVNRHFIPYEENEMMQGWVKAIVAQTQGDISNITKSLGFSLLYGTERVFTPLSEYYQKYLDRACLDVVTGAFDYNTVMRRVVKEMTASGIRTVTYANGYSNRIEVAARRAVMTGVHQLSEQINEQVAKDLGTDTFEVTAHLGARPSHQIWQGQVYNKEELVRVCGLGTGGGLCGWNCRHSYYAFIPGISVRTYTDEQLEEMKQKDNEVRTWNGKEYTGYEATQKQRQLETKMRAQRASVKQLKNGKGSSEDIQAAQAKYVHTLHEYQAFSKKMGLPEQMERVYMDGLGRIAPRDRLLLRMMNDTSGSRKANYKMYNKGLSSEGLLERCKKANEINEKYTTRKSKWSGNVVVDDAKCKKERISGRKEWSCDILLFSKCQDKTVIHEELHSRSGSYLNKFLYFSYGSIEEASVELLAREICKNERIPYNESYDAKVDALYEINNRIRICDSNLDFAQALFAKDLRNRYNWLEKKVEKYLQDNDQDVDAMQALLKRLKGINL